MASQDIVSLDGGNVTNVTGLAVPQQQVSLPMDAMQEFRIISNNYAAEHGHSTGGVVTLSTRAGTNKFHGRLQSPPGQGAERQRRAAPRGGQLRL